MTDQGQKHLEKARQSLTQILQDKRLSPESRQRLSEEYRQLQRLLNKLEKAQVHVAVLGRVGVGKSALLNALIGREVFAVSVLHGCTEHSEEALWRSVDTGGVYLIDTPGIDEVDGEVRAQIADSVARQADIIIFVVDGDMTDIEYDALSAVYQVTQPMILVLNKADQYSKQDIQALLMHLRARVHNMIAPERVIATSAHASTITLIEEDSDGVERRRHSTSPPQVEVLREMLWQLLKNSGLSYSALNASVFASRLSEKIGVEIIATRQALAERIIRQYALFKAIAIAVNPLPIVDLFALAADSGMIVHLSKVYGINFTRHEAGKLIRTIAMQTGLLMGTVYGVQFFSSVLKGITGGLSTIITATTQASMAFYGSYVIGKAAQQYFIQGASWGENSAKQVLQDILRDLDKETLMTQAQDSIQQILGMKK